jgi:hypothetical protein
VGWDRMVEVEVVKPAITNNSNTKRSNDLLQTILYEREYPDPRTLPSPPPSPEPRLQLTLSEVTARKYVSITARVVFLRTLERRDALGTKLVFSDVLEDSTFKIPFVSHRISFLLIRNSVYSFKSTYLMNPQINRYY